jgi:membrane protease YdiL (CAAX protease family)
MMARRMARPRDARDVPQVRIAVLAIALAGLAGMVAPLAGAAADAVLVVVLALTASRSASAGGLLLVPMLRLLWVTMPVRGVEPLHWTALIAGPFLLLALLVARSGGLTVGSVGLARAGSAATIGAIAYGWAIAGLLLAIVAGDAVAWGRAGGWIAWLPVLGYALLIAAAEEIAFRGVLPAMLARTQVEGAMATAVVAAATLALGAGSPWWIAIAVVTPVASGLIVSRTGSLYPVIVGHALFLVALNV